MAMKVGELATALEVPQVFTHEQFGEIRIRVDANNDIEINLEDAARGLGFTQTKNGVEYVLWWRVNGYLKDFGFSTEVWKGDSSSISGGNDAYIPEHIFYRLAMKAKNEAAEKFQDWIAREVIPSIRKRGYYVAPTAESYTITPMLLRQIADQLEAKDKKIAAQADVIEMQGAKLAEQDAQIERMKPKACYYDVILACKDTVATTTIAKDYGMSAIKFNKLLHELGVQFKQSGIWYPYQAYAALGWTQTRTANYVKDGEVHAKVYSSWTQTGRRGLYELLKEYGYLPKIEQDAKAPDSAAEE